LKNNRPICGAGWQPAADCSSARRDRQNGFHPSRGFSAASRYQTRQAPALTIGCVTLHENAF
jgi:hypothetical protein